jgi:hypothetical protein
MLPLSMRATSDTRPILNSFIIKNPRQRGRQARYGQKADDAAVELAHFPYVLETEEVKQYQPEDDRRPDGQSQVRTNVLKAQLGDNGR